MKGSSQVKRIILMRLSGLVAACIVVAVLVAVNSKMNPIPTATPEPRDRENEPDLESGQREQPSNEELERMVAEHQDKLAVIETDFGSIRFKFYPENAPRTVENFVQLAEKGFYDGSPFHRIVKDFVIQGGSPDGSPDGGPGHTIPAEFNERRHVEGTVAMARARDPDSAGSQFYICLKPAPQLDGQYTVFGQLVEGMDVVRKIAQVETGAGDRPLEKIAMKKVRIERPPGPTTPE